MMTSLQSSGISSESGVPSVWFFIKRLLPYQPLLRLARLTPAIFLRLQP